MAENMFMINPELERHVCAGGGIYILYGSGNAERREALCIFQHMLCNEMYVSGFVSKCDAYIGLKIFGKKINRYFAPTDESKVIILDKLMEDGESISAKFHQPFYVLNSKIRMDHIVIWGCGTNGSFVYHYLKKRNIQIDVFVDSNPEKVGGQKYQIPILGTDSLSKLPENIAIIEAANSWQQMDEILTTQGIAENRFYYATSGWRIFTEENQSFSVFQLKVLADKLTDKRVYIYSENAKIADCWEKYLSLLDFDCAGVIPNNIEEILYEKNRAVVVLADKIKDLYILKECGIEDQDVVCVYGDRVEHYPHIYDIIPYDLDINLGYTWMGEKYPGIKIYGKENKDDYKIAVLGGSTTDGHDWPYKSWPEFLFDKYDDANITIYNGGVSGYRSSHELIKLIRDMFCLKPDMIIVYDGVNDSGNTTDSLFADYYLESVFRFAACNMEPGYDGYERSGKVYRGVSIGDKNSFDIWLFNIELMHAIAVDRGIQFYSFLQPVIYSKKGINRREQEIILSSPVAYSEQVQPLFKDMAKEKEIFNTHNYMYDFSGIFDDIYDVYIDTCHVNERGNSIIADEIYEVIRQRRKV